APSVAPARGATVVRSREFFASPLLNTAIGSTRCFGESVCPGLAALRLIDLGSRVDRLPVLPDLEMEVRSGRSTRIAAQRDHFVKRNRVRGRHEQLGGVPVHG